MCIREKKMNLLKKFREKNQTNGLKRKKKNSRPDNGNRNNRENKLKEFKQELQRQTSLTGNKR